MTRIYKVIYEEKWSGCAWMKTAKNVSVKGDAFAAVSKAKRTVLAQSWKVKDSNKVEKCIGFRFLEVTLLAEAEL